MGTFHDTSDPLHGITVVAERGDTVFVGRCHVREHGQVVLLDVDEHTEGDDGKSKQEYLDRAARFGVWKKHERLTLPADEITSLAPLSEFFGRGDASGKATATKVAPAPAPAPVETMTTLADSVATDAPIQLTAAAVSEVQRLIEAEGRSDEGLRLAVSGGGCSGLVYKVEFDGQKDGDVIVPFAGFDVLMDRKSTVYLRGVVLDHQQGLSGRGFQFNNPNASNTCGCGESFSV